MYLQLNHSFHLFLTSLSLLEISSCIPPSTPPALLFGKGQTFTIILTKHSISRSSCSKNKCWYLKVPMLLSWMPRQFYPIFPLHSPYTPSYPYIFFAHNILSPFLCSILLVHTIIFPSFPSFLPMSTMVVLFFLLVYLHTASYTHLFPPFYQHKSSHPSIFSIIPAHTLLSLSLPHHTPVLSIPPAHTWRSPSFPSRLPVYTITFPSFLLDYICATSYLFPLWAYSGAVWMT